MQFCDGTNWVALGGNGAAGSETDPQVGALVSGKWCTSNGSAINCSSDAPLASVALDDVTDVTITSGASGDVLYYNGSGWVNQALSGLVSTDRIVSGTANVTVNTSGYISLTTGGTNTGYFDTAGRLAVPGISLTTPQASFTTLYAANRAGVGTAVPSTTLDVSGTTSTRVLNLRAFSGVSAPASYQGGHWTVTPTGIYYSGGNVGIGTAEPTYKLDVAAGAIRIANSESSGWSEIDLFSGRTVSDEKVWNIANNGSNGALMFRALDDSRTVALVDPLSILRNGNVGIGTGNPGTALDVVSTDSYPSGVRVTSAACPTLFFDEAGSGAYSMALHYCDDGNQLRFARHADSFGTWQANVFTMDMVSGNFWVSGQGYQPGGGSWADSSDERLKHNIRPIAGALEKLARLQGVEFDWRKPKAHGNQPHSGGFIAQDVQQVFPEFITSEKCDAEECGLVDQGNVLKLSLPFVFDAYVVEAIKELKSENDDLRAKLDVLSRSVEKLRAAAYLRTM